MNRNPADLAAVGAAVSGRAGTTVPLRVGVRNRGPASYEGLPADDRLPADWLATVSVTAPTGTELTTLDDRCTSVVGRTAYRCTIRSDVAVGASELFEFQLRIVAATAGTGWVRSTGRLDTTSANNTAAITIAAAPGAGSLPVSGTATGRLAASGAALLALGVLLLVLTRRRTTGPYGRPHQSPPPTR